LHAGAVDPFDRPIQDVGGFNSAGGVRFIRGFDSDKTAQQYQKIS